VSFDSYLYQTIENKQKFISQIMTSKEIAQRFSDIDETVLNYAEIKALCSGNPLIKDKLDIEREIGNLEIMRRSHNTQRHRLEDLVNTKGPERLRLYTAYADEVRKDLETLAQYPLNKDDKDIIPAFEIKGKVYTDKKEAAAALMEACLAQAGEIGSARIGTYRDFGICARYSFTNSNFDLTLNCHHSYVIQTGKSADGNLTRINNALSEVSLLETLEKFEAKIKETESEIATAKEQLQHSFPQEAEYQEKLARLEEISRELGIGVDAELEQAEKSEAARVEAEKSGTAATVEADKSNAAATVEAGRNDTTASIEAVKPDTAGKIEVLKPNEKPEADVSDGYFDFMNKTGREAEKPRPDIKKKRAYEAAM
jgi:hypothetical protein